MKKHIPRMKGGMCFFAASISPWVRRRALPHGEGKKGGESPDFLRSRPAGAETAENIETWAHKIGLGKRKNSPQRRQVLSNKNDPAHLVVEISGIEPLTS